MSKTGEFSEEQSEELISHLKSGDHSEFEQLRSALNLLAHVTVLPPTSIPPVLPSSISQPVPLLPVKSSKPRRTAVTSIMVTGLFASASLAAAAVTGIGPAAIVNVGHEAAKFVKGVVSGVAHVVASNPSDATRNQTASSQIPLAIPSPTLASDEGNNQSDSEKFALVIPPLSNLFPPVSTESNSHENDSQKTNSSHETQGPNAKDSPPAKSEGNKEPTNNENQNQPSSRPSEKPRPEPSPEQPTAEPSAEPTIAPTANPSAEPTDSEN